MPSGAEDIQVGKLAGDHSLALDPVALKVIGLARHHYLEIGSTAPSPANIKVQQPQFLAATSLQQRAVPDELRGRVSAVYRFIGFGELSLGALLSDLLAEMLDIRAVFIVTTALTLSTLVPFARVVTEVRIRDSGSGVG